MSDNEQDTPQVPNVSPGARSGDGLTPLNRPQNLQGSQAEAAQEQSDAQAEGRAEAEAAKAQQEETGQDPVEGEEDQAQGDGETTVDGSTVVASDDDNQ